jgi:hypothetical protein
MKACPIFDKGSGSSIFTIVAIADAYAPLVQTRRKKTTGSLYLFGIDEFRNRASSFL